MRWLALLLAACCAGALFCAFASEFWAFCICSAASPIDSAAGGESLPAFS